MAEKCVVEVKGAGRVRGAAIALCKALLRDAGLTLRDLKPARAPAAGKRRQPTAPPPPPAAPEAPPPPPAAPARAPAAKLAAPESKPYERALARAGLMPHPTRRDLVAPIPATPGVVAKAAKHAGPVIVPEGVKVTVCPSGRDTRFAAEPGHVGEFSRDWQQRRGVAC